MIVAHHLAAAHSFAAHLGVASVDAHVATADKVAHIRWQEDHICRYDYTLLLWVGTCIVRHELHLGWLLADKGLGGLKVLLAWMTVVEELLLLLGRMAVGLGGWLDLDWRWKRIADWNSDAGL